VRNLVLLALLPLLAVAGDEPPGAIDQIRAWVPDPAELTIKDRGLLRGHADRKALFPDPDPWLWPSVRAALDKPLEVADTAEAVARKALAAKTPFRVWKALEPYGGHRGEIAEEIPAYELAELRKLEALHPKARAAIERLYGCASIAATNVGLALKPLDAEEQEFLRENLTRWLGRTTDADRERSLKGEENVEERKALMRCAVLMSKVDEPYLRAAAATVQVAVAQAIPDLLLQKNLAAKRTVIETPLGPIVLRGSGGGGGVEDALILIDFGGDDEFKTAKEPKDRPVRIVIDLAGDDLYLAQSPFAWGSALLGVSVLADASGDDDYRGADWSLGCGVGGHAVLWDLAGSDRYMGGLATQGVGIFGSGLLVDGAGDDDYHAGVFAQGFASSGGVGVIVDRAGNDTYLAGRDEEDMWRRPKTWVTFAQGSSYSHRFGHILTEEGKPRRWKMTGQVAGGIGLLFDGGGDDRYHADVFGQGAAYWYGLAALVDIGGNDRYRTTWYGQGVGTHAAVGCVVDAAGNDSYHSRNTSQGCGHDFSAGILVDRAGNDRYRSLTLSQGAGNASSGIGVLIDEGGDDHYHCRNNAWGVGRPLPKRPELAPYGFFVDMGGKNSYTGNYADKRTKGTWRRGERGFGVDRSETGETAESTKKGEK
jgi:hypothetical protein